MSDETYPKVQKQRTSCAMHASVGQVAHEARLSSLLITTGCDEHGDEEPHTQCWSRDAAERLCWRLGVALGTGLAWDKIPPMTARMLVWEPDAQKMLVWEHVLGSGGGFTGYQCSAWGRRYTRSDLEERAERNGWRYQALVVDPPEDAP